MKIDISWHGFTSYLKCYTVTENWKEQRERSYGTLRLSGNNLSTLLGTLLSHKLSSQSNRAVHRLWSLTYPSSAHYIR